MSRAARALARADRFDDLLARRRGDPPGWDLTGSSGPVAAAWAVAKLAVVVPSLPVLAPMVGITAARNTARTKRIARRYADVVDDVIAGREGSDGWNRVIRVPAGDRYFVASDLHRYVRGRFDWPGGQRTKSLYAAVLRHYADADHALIEAGDVEDFWLVGGSTYAAAYDALRTYALARRGEEGRTLLAELHAEHLRRVVANNRDVYDVIERRFNARGRYHRLIGNHDDAYADPRVVDALAEVHPGIQVADFVAFDAPDGAVGVVTHGHHTDSWNGPGRSGLGRLGTSLASMVADIPRFGRDLGLPPPEATTTLLSGDHVSALTPVSAVFGANLEQYSVDEVLLFESFVRKWGGDPGSAHDLDDGPFVLLGHTHLPLSWPVDPRSGRAWRKYLNTGSGIHDGMVTGVEWDGSADPHHPDLCLVAWHWADVHPGTPDDAIVGEVDGRPFARRVTSRIPPARTLSLEPR